MQDQNEVVQPQSRRSVLGLSLVLAGVPFCVSGLLVGGALSKGLPLSGAAGAAVVGALITTLYAGFIGAIGARTGLSTTALMKQCFGSAGATLVAAVLAICLVGWYAVQTGFFGQTISTLFPKGGVITSPQIASLWGGLLMLTSAFFGIRGLSYVSWIGVPLFAVLSVWGLWAAVDQIDIWSVQPVAPLPFGDAVTLMIGSFAVGATVNADILRYAKNARHAWIATASGFFAANVFVVLCGAAASAATGTGDLINAMVVLGLGLPALLVLIFGQWTTNDNNLFYASTNLSSAFPRIDRRAIVLACGVVATLLGVFGVADRFVPFLIWLGVLIPPIGGVMIAHYVIMRAQPVETKLPKFYALPFVAWVCGSVVGASVKFGAPAINSIVAAGLIYLLLMIPVRSRMRRNSAFAEI